MRTDLKFGISVLLLAAVVLGSAAPVAAERYRGGFYGHGYYGSPGYHDGGLGDVLLGAALIGSGAVLASAISQHRSYDPGYDGYTAPVYPYAGYPVYPYPDPRQVYASRADAVTQCSRAAELAADQNGGVARVVGIDRVLPYGDGWRVFGMLQIDRGDDGYGPAPRPERTRLDCTASYGRVTGLQLG